LFLLQGLGGLIVALLNVATIAVWNGQDLSLSAFMFFIVSVVVIVLCISERPLFFSLPKRTQAYAARPPA